MPDKNLNPKLLIVVDFSMFLFTHFFAFLIFFLKYPIFMHAVLRKPINEVAIQKTLLYKNAT